MRLKEMCEANAIALEFARVRKVKERANVFYAGYRAIKKIMSASALLGDNGCRHHKGHIDIYWYNEYLSDVVHAGNFYEKNSIWIHKRAPISIHGYCAYGASRFTRVWLNGVNL
ncbi:hypothetical protein ACX4ER_003941 [Cronobacter dublinensis]|uniref:hypothetical protein n=1 Tax=Cronobacter dublinensis TaxID=413497 RepID=UPI0024AE1470|nr:hypothetical protein [Cronobacter dublinensis]MDI6446225.1 hypothetical protein [Cronobacter dublinensis]